MVAIPSRVRKLSGVPMAAALLCAVPAHASAVSATLPSLIAAPSQQLCAISLVTNSASAPTLAIPADMAKAAAIQGGTLSALDRIRLQQSGFSAPSVAAPASRPAVLTADCSASMQLAAPSAAAPVTAGGNSSDFLATSRIAIRKTVFSNRWQRVSHSHLTAAQAASLTGGRTGHSLAMLQLVNRSVNHAIAYGDDWTVWRQRDYWATASQTLRRGRGDCEDMAILKYQVLLALGYDPKDLYLTLARDLVRNADHALLIVHEGGRYYMLDDSTDTVLPANTSHDYRPMLSFNSQSAWLHGYTQQPAPRTELAYLSVNASLSPRVTGLNR